MIINVHSIQNRLGYLAVSKYLKLVGRINKNYLKDLRYGQSDSLNLQMRVGPVTIDNY